MTVIVDPWFVTRRIADGVFLVGEPPHVNCYLVVGTRRAVLVDTGLGVANMRHVVEQLTDRELLVVNSHSHWDHRGGNAPFDDIAFHEAGVERMTEPIPSSELVAYADSVAELLERYGRYKDIDDAYFRLLMPEFAPRPLPGGFDASGWVVPPTVPGLLLREGDELDLGGRVLRVLHTPGHTADSICLLDEGNGHLFAGDTLATGPHTASLPGADPDEFLRSLTRLATEVAPLVRSVHACHMVRYDAPGSLVTEVATAFARIRTDPPVFTTSQDAAGRTHHEYWFAGFSLIVPAVWATGGPE